MDEHSTFTRLVGLDYYHRAFALIHKEFADAHQDFKAPHPMRSRFWQLVPPGTYTPHEGRVLLNTYLVSVETELARIIGPHSLAYFLHLYRRLAPGPVGYDEQPATIGLTRAILEAATQKYASLRFCNKIACSASVPIESVLGGILMSPQFEMERRILSESIQLVLTDFTSPDLADFYNVERLAYEIWRTAAALRITGKGAGLIVNGPPECFFDDRSPELNSLVTSYDKRSETESWSGSHTGVILEDPWQSHMEGIIFLPVYNLFGVTAGDLRALTERFGARLNPEMKFNFVWIPLNLREYRIAHLPLGNAFEQKYHVPLDAVLAVVAAMESRVFYSWNETGVFSFLKYWQRAYDGPHERDSIRDQLLAFMPSACETLAIKESELDSTHVDAAISFWGLDTSNRSAIDLAYPGPHHVFLPIHEDQVFVDYAWILRRLHDLFLGVWIPDQNFKGDALERVVRGGKSLLPIKPCKANSGETRQIDFATALGKHLIIAECKAVGMSIAFDRGEPEAIQYRTENVVERALREVDDKARWLAAHPVGSNYDIRGYEDILPVAISPFVEFIPSLDTRYWISKDLPRVLTPRELQSLLADTATVGSAMNIVPLR